MIQEEPTRYDRQVQYIPVHRWAGFSEATAPPGGRPKITCWADSVGHRRKFTDLSMKVGEDISHSMVLPPSWDLSHDIGVKIQWTGSGDVVQAIPPEWVFLYGPAEIGLDTTLFEASNEDGITSGLQECGVALRLRVVAESGRGIIPRGTLGPEFMFKVELRDVTGPEGNEINLLGVVFDFIPEVAVGVA